MRSSGILLYPELPTRAPMKKETKPKKGPPKPNKHKPHIPFERLTAMIEALESNGELDATIRAEMHDALDCLYMLEVMRLKASSRRKKSQWEFTVRLAHELVKQHGLNVTEAVLTANPKLQKASDIEAATHQYHAMKRRGSLDYQWINDERVALAAGRVTSIKGMPNRNPEGE